MKRIAIIGCAGSGKSTLAPQLGKILNLPVIHLDAEYWKPGWVETPKPEWYAHVQSLISADEWIMDGNYGGTRSLRLEAADTVIFLDFPRGLCLRRVVQRRWRYRGRSRPDMGAGCNEKIDWTFLRWIWRFPKASRPAILRQVEELADRKTVIVLHSPKETRAFLASLPIG